MNIQIFGKSKCFDTKKAERWFKERRIKYQLIDVAKYGMSRGEYASVKKAVGGMDKLFDEKSKAYEQQFIKYLAHDEDKEEKLFEHPELFKTPDSPKRQAGNGRLLPGDMERLGIISLALKAISEQ